MELRKKTEMIVVHCAATKPSMDIGASEIKKWHDLIPYAVANWKQSNWFGVFAVFESDWIYHEKLAWVYVHQAEQGLWLYLEGEGWHWTIPLVYPHLFSHLEKKWKIFR